ncbi:alpha/beta hydrolase family protein [Skeletonema marinoi]|uniref:Alpha/beta hydrolase family protein n=1 Tax=Skeletonema marinoi TaxID=267567 RepID=A0AAD8Y1C7_9STRA|nr:alpha/beta hydrolase family protein [Skeletonema marinoi]
MASPQQWKQWTCDELTPNLCELQVESGSVTIKSIPVHYWRYTRKKNDDGNKNDDNQESYQSMSNSNNSSISHSIIALHGGPGWPHSYLLPLKQLACRGDTAEVIFYDQAGCGDNSLEYISRHNNKRRIIIGKRSVSTFTSPIYYSEIELPTLIHHWKLQRYHVLGHSWGTILAQLFALNYVNKHNKNTTVEGFNTKEEGLQSLILSGPISNAQAYISAQWNSADQNNLASLPPFVQHRIHALEESKAYDSMEYKAIDSVLSTFFTLRTAPPPDCFGDSAAGVNEEVYVGMQGASEFTISGVLGDLDLTSRLPELSVPVLLTHGKYDTMRPSTVKAIQDQIPISERVMFPHSGHVSMIDDAGLMNDVVASFIHRVEEGVEIGGMNEGETTKAAAAADGTVEEGDAVKDSPSHSWTWIKVVTAFLAGLVIGELKIGRRRNGDGYTSIA